MEEERVQYREGSFKEAETLKAAGKCSKTEARREYGQKQEMKGRTPSV